MILELSSDPYDENEEDLNLCGADKSSLWEIKSLQSHVLPEISRAARFIDKPNLGDVERKFNSDISSDQVRLTILIPSSKGRFLYSPVRGYNKLLRFVCFSAKFICKIFYLCSDLND